ncbi:MAG: hypothetical protein AAB456_00120 [Patescibacteria group bacterium]
MKSSKYIKIPLLKNAINVVILEKGKQFGGSFPIKELKKNPNQYFKDIKREIKKYLKLK